MLRIESLSVLVLQCIEIARTPYILYMLRSSYLINKNSKMQSNVPYHMETGESCVARRKTFLKRAPKHGTCTLLLANDGAVSLLCQSASDPRGCALYTSICATHFIMLRTSSCVCLLPMHDHIIVCVIMVLIIMIIIAG